MGLNPFLGLSTGGLLGVCFPAGLSSIALMFLFILIKRVWIQDTNRKAHLVQRISEIIEVIGGMFFYLYKPKNVAYFSECFPSDSSALGKLRSISLDQMLFLYCWKLARRIKIYNQFVNCRHCMQPILSQQFLQQYSLLNSDNREVSTKANKYILQTIEHPQILQHAIQMALTKNNSVRLQMLAAHLIYIKLQNDCNKIHLEQFLRLKELIWLRLIDCQYEKGAENILCSIMGILVIVLYPQNWSNFVQEMIDFMRSDINRFNYGLTILQRAATELHNQSISRSLRLKAMKAFHQEYSQLMQVFQFIIELNIQDLNCKLLGILQEWSVVNLPLLKSSIIIEFVLKQVMSQSSIIRLGTLPTIKNTLKHAFYGKKQDVCLSLNFNERGLTSEQMQSLNKITEFLIKENIWFYQSLQLHQEDQDIENYIQIINTLLFSYSFLLLTPKGEQLLQLPQFLFKSSFKKISYSTFNLWSSFYNFMQNYKKQAKLLHLDELASQMLLVLLKKVALTKEHIQQEMNQNDQTHNFGQMGFFQYRDATTSVFKAIHDFFLENIQNKETGAQFFVEIILKHLDAKQKSIWVELIFFIIQACFGRGLDESDYQTLKVLNILKNILQFCGEQKEEIHELAVTRMLTTIKDYRFQISQNHELYLLSLKFTVKYLTSENTGHNAALSFDKLLQLAKADIRKNVIQQVLELYLKHDFSSLGIRQKILSAIMKLNSKQQNFQLKFLVFEQIIKNIQNNLQTIHKVYQLESLPNAQPYLNTMTQIEVLCQNLSELQIYSQKYVDAQKRNAELSVMIMNEILEYGLKYTQSLQDYNTLVKCTKKFEQIVDCSPNRLVFQIFPQTLVQLLDKVFSLFQIKNLNSLLDHGKLVIVVAKLLKIMSYKANEKVCLWLKQNVLRLNEFFFQYYELKCNPDFKEVDPDIIRAYFTLEEAFCIYKYQLFLEQIPQTILQFSVVCLQKIVQKKIQRQILSFILNILSRRQICETSYQVGSCLAISLISLSSIMDSPSQTLLAKILIYLFVNIVSHSHTSIVSEAMESPNFHFLNAEMKSIVAYYMSFFTTRQNLTYTKAIFSHFNELKYSDREDEHYAESFSLIYRKWSKTIESNSQNQEECLSVYSDD